MNTQRNIRLLGAIFIIALGFSVPIHAQITFQRTFGGKERDWGESVQQTTDGGYIIVGGTMSYGAGWSDVYLIKTDVNGNVLWTRTYGGRERDRGYSVQQTSDGGYIIVGSTLSFGSGRSDIYLIKTNAEGLTGVEER
jgi:outer membrane protein assembly factor BamB